MVYSTLSGEGGTVAQGVQIPFEIYTLTSIPETEGIQLSVKAYPNPTSNFLTLRVDESDLAKLSYQLFDSSGKLLQYRRIANRLTNVDMNELAPATYFLRISDSKKDYKSFKIIKK